MYSGCLVSKRNIKWKGGKTHPGQNFFWVKYTFHTGAKPVITSRGEAKKFHLM